MRPLLSLVTIFLLTLCLSAQAKQLPDLPMKEWAARSSTIVFCDEEKVERKVIEHVKDEHNSSAWTETKWVVKCRVRESFKGALKPGDQLVMDYDCTFQRHMAEDEGRFEMLANGQIVRVGGPAEIPAGRALLFLVPRKAKVSAEGNSQAKNDFRVATAKLVTSDKGVLTFRQAMNPGPLVLSRQQPENLTLPEGQKYSEADLLADLRLALKDQPENEDKAR